MAKTSFTPQKLKSLLIFLLVVVILGGGALFYFGVQILQTYATEVNHRLIDAEASENEISRLKAMQGRLSESEALIAKADALFATNDSYQSEARQAVENYANQVGLSIDSVEVLDLNATGLYGVSVQFDNPTSYSKLVQFITLIQGNLPKMQLSSIDLKHIPGSTSDQVDSGKITISVAVR